jgi:GTP cyclohydrolase I
VSEQDTAPGRIVDASKLDLIAAERAALDLLWAIGADVDAPGLLGTPRRVAASLAELLTPAEFAATMVRDDARTRQELFSLAG